MGLFDRIKDLILTKSENVPVAKPSAFLVEPKREFIQAPQVFVEPPKPASFTVAKPVKPRRGLKYRVLHLGALILILLNLGIGLFFFSSNQMFNVALLSYLGFSTLVLGHYFSLTR